MKRGTTSTHQVSKEFVSGNKDFKKGKREHNDDSLPLSLSFISLCLSLSCVVVVHANIYNHYVRTMMLKQVRGTPEKKKKLVTRI